MRRKWQAKAGPRRGLEGTEGEPMIGGVKSEDSLATGLQEGGLEGNLHRVGSRHREKHLALAHRRKARDQACELCSPAMGMHVGETVEKPTGLIPHCGDDLRVTMTHCGNAKSRGEVDEAVAVDIQDVGAASLFPDESCFVGTQSVDAGSLVPG